MHCTSCGALLPPTGKFCAACGAQVNESQAETIFTRTGDSGETIAVDLPPRTPVRRVSPSHPSHPSATPGLTSSDPLGGARFAPGQILADRYRIVALAGKGGMGEVYRAEDLKLGPVVAIKFLPPSVSKDPSMLARFHSEVRIARQVSHPNVCRVFDIGDIDGTSFLTMEYVDGEDLASVVRRVGRLSSDKAIEITRQMCAGLAAAHDKGVVHRDLKPANVMLDSAGKIHITDFGLAGLAATIQGAEIRAGTPAYMSPEQLAGTEVTPRSDIYSLGLILYELLTGKRAFEAATLPELMKMREEGRITSPSTIVRDVDPVTERVIHRCLEADPAKRPASALQVAAALPGGDPLAAALAAGETPSPEMVAAAGATEGLRPRIALLLFAITLVALAAYTVASNRTKLSSLAPLENPPEVLRAKARETIRRLGFTEPAEDFADGFETSDEYLIHVATNDKSPNRWNALAKDRPASITYWYRQSPRELVPHRFFGNYGSGVVTGADPSRNITGMIYLVLDSSGHLLFFERIPPQKDAPAASPPAPDWAALFAAAGLNQADYQSAGSEWAPLAAADTRAAWTLAAHGSADLPPRIEAAAYRGNPIYFQALYPWDKPSRDEPYVPGTHERWTTFTFLAIFFLILAASIYLARRAKKQNRGDARGAERLATFVQLAFFIAWLLRAHHLGSASEFEVFVIGLAWSLLLHGLARVLYFALEPFVRRKDPHTLISWSRLMSGQWRDPLVGRDLLVGVLYGVALTCFESSDYFLLPWLGKLPPAPGALATPALFGIRDSMGLILTFTWIFTLYTLLIFFFLFLVRLVVRKDWIAAAVIVAVGVGTNFGAQYLWLQFFYAGVVWLSIYLILRRFGLLTLVVGLVVQNVLIVFPLTTRLSVWYSGSVLTALLLVLIVSGYGFYTSLGGRPVFSGNLLDR